MAESIVEEILSHRWWHRFLKKSRFYKVSGKPKFGHLANASCALGLNWTAGRMAEFCNKSSHALASVRDSGSAAKLSTSTVVELAFRLLQNLNSPPEMS
jgi:hypothetical protein